jgi:predicted metal-dependent peptidase
MTTELMKQANTALNKAKIALMSKPDSVFFTTLCFSMKHVWSEEVPTAACDGKKVYWNPAFFMDLANAEERVFLMLHEVMHAAYLHMDPVRTAGKCADRWNIACDHVINLQLIDRGFTMPTGKNKGVADSQFIGMNADQVYKLLPDNPGKPNQQDLMDPGEAMETVRADMADVLIRAAVQSKAAGDKAGTIPGEIDIFLNKLLNPKLPWHRILQKYIKSFDKHDYTFKRPNRRFFPKHHLPSLYSETLIDLAVFIDASGSVSDLDFLRFVTEFAGILRMMKPKKMTLGTFDTTVKSTHEIANIADLMAVKFTGRGGTNIEPVIHWANEHKPQLLLIFTDGHFRFSHTETKIPLIWLINNHPGFKAPTGKVIHYEM